MDKVGRVGAAGPIATGRVRAGQGEFRLLGAAASAARAPSLVELPGLLALQEAEAEWAQDRPARRHAHAMLDELAALQRDALAGAIDPAALRRLANLVRTMPTAADPRLTAVLRSVSVRAAVELARIDL